MFFSKFLVCSLIILASLATSSFAQSTNSQADALSTASTQTSPRFPEPMVFDLVRPLHAQKGELEINSLFLRPLTGASQPLEWAPEVEYAFRDRYTVEFEFPFENQHFGEYKIALQGTFKNESARFAHGWQWIGRYKRHARSKVTDGLYLAGYQFAPRWSVFSMTGTRLSRTQRQTRVQGLFNPSVFYNAKPGLTLGLEHNFVLARHGEGQRLFMPQAQVTLTKRYSFQIGIGGAQHGKSAAKPVLGLRLVVTLNGGNAH